MSDFQQLYDQFEQRLPRYTSYPAAPHFSTINSDTQSSWLGQIKPNEALSLYIHVPFCKQLCWFCGCTTTVVNSHKPVARFTDILIEEIMLVGQSLKNAPTNPVKHIHFGGGSPSILSIEDFNNIMNVLKWQFNLLELSEIAVEIDPRNLTPEKARNLALNRVTRVSLGVQDFNLKVQKAINRIQPLEVIEDAFAMLKQNNINHINMDLIFGLPEQTIESTQNTALTAIGLKPSRISLFPYAHVPWMKKHQQLIKEDRLPAQETRLKMAENMRNIFLDAGYVAIGMDHFALKDDSLVAAMNDNKMKRNFQGYSDDEGDILIGFGPSAISKLPDGYVQNNPKFNDYFDAVTHKKLAAFKGHPLSAEDKANGEVIAELLCHFEADLGAIADKFNLDYNIFTDAIKRLEAFAPYDVLALQNKILRVKEKDPALVRIIAARFDEYLHQADNNQDTVRYSKLA